MVPDHLRDGREDVPRGGRARAEHASGAYEGGAQSIRGEVLGDDSARCRGENDDRVHTARKSHVRRSRLCCARAGARWTRRRARGRRREVCSGARGTCSGRVRTGARGMRGRAQRRLGKGTWRCCSGRVRTGAPWAGGAAGARENGCPWDEKTCGGAAKKGHLASERMPEAPDSRSSRDNAATRRQASHENFAARFGSGCPWNRAPAAERGHLEVLRWARQNGCEWDEETCSGFAASSRFT